MAITLLAIPVLILEVSLGQAYRGYVWPQDLKYSVISDTRKRNGRGIQQPEQTESRCWSRYDLHGYAGLPIRTYHLRGVFYDELSD